MTGIEVFTGARTRKHLNSGFSYLYFIDWLTRMQAAYVTKLPGYNRGMLPEPAERPLYQRIYDVVRQVPRGRVTTYGRVARIVGGISAQMVGFALAALPNRPDGEDVPWQRVVNAQGKVSPHGFGFGTAIQRQLLEDEDIIFDLEGRIDLDQFGW